MPSTTEFFIKFTERYRPNPKLFVEEILNAEPDSWQEEVALSLAENKFVTVRSGHGVGKTALEAWLVLWFLMTNPYPRVVCTAPTQQQLRDVMWSELAKWQSKSPLLQAMLSWTKTYLSLKGAEKRCFAVARVAAKPENMQGFHEENMLFIVDEASGVEDDIMEAIFGTLTGGNNRLLLCGNPTRSSGVFFESHHGKRGSFKKFRVNAEESIRTSQENIEAMEKSYGKDSNVYRVRVLGEFPTQDDDVFIALEDIERSILLGKDYKIKKNESGVTCPDSIHIGCDVARFGDDMTVIGYKLDEKIEFHKKIRGQDLMQTAADIASLGFKLIKKYNYKGKIPVKVDDSGLGGGVTDRLRQLKKETPELYQWMEIYPINFGTNIKHEFYADSTSLMMSIVKKLIKPDEGEEIGAYLPDDTDLVGQLSSRRYKMNERGKIVVESKNDMKRRNLPSPDEADCVLLLCLPVRMKKE